MNIVIVEDEIRIREGILRLVEKINDDYHVVATAENGLEGYNCIKELKPDVVITDIMMEEMSGMEMLSKLKEEGIMRNFHMRRLLSDLELRNTLLSRLL